MTVRVVNLGLPKSGTTTLARALRRAGFRVADHRLPTGRRRPDFVAERLYRGYFDSGDPGALLPDHDALSEISLLRGGKSLWPQTDLALIEALRQHHPGLKLVATRRGGDAIAASMRAWNNLGTTRLPARDVPGLPAGHGGSQATLTRWIDGHYATLARYFRGDPDFLDLPVDDPRTPERLASHLGCAIPWWGRANANPTRRAMG
ncbi:MAG: sulfotransferase family protein [Marinibacterium sp.]|nr:sulfotransferase family protein [Marinibacterium sp.]